MSIMSKKFGCRLLAGLLVSALLISSVGCGKKESSESETKDAEVTSEQESVPGGTTVAEVNLKDCTFEIDPDFSYDESLMLSNVIKVGDDLALVEYKFESDETSAVEDTATASDGDTEEDMMFVPGSKVSIRSSVDGSMKEIYVTPEDITMDTIRETNGNLASWNQTSPVQRKPLRSLIRTEMRFLP